MALTNNERVSRALSLLRSGLAPFVDRELNGAIKRNKVDYGTLHKFGKDPNLGDLPFSKWDVAALLNVMLSTWHDVFQDILGHTERTLVHELRTHRNAWAHQRSFSGDDVYRVLDSVARLLDSISASQSEEVHRLKRELLRTRYEQQFHSERRKVQRKLAVGHVTGIVKPWRQIAVPHEDVSSGQYRQAEFAADLWQVYLGEGSNEYVDPVEFFSRTFLTESLDELLVSGLRRLSGRGGDPVVQLQTNFGGGKTHSMLALYHLFSGAEPGNLEGIASIMQKAGVSSVPKVRRVVLVGNKISPGNPSEKEDGTVVRTLWGELVWQLGGPSAFAHISKDDKNATNPGDVLRKLLNEFGPSLILIDEWVAYARQLHDHSDLPGGSFETQFTFAQALTESVKAAENCMLVVSLPASDTAISPHVEVDDIEVGGRRGHAALNRLRNVVGRIETSWRPANAQEGFEIVRRRLFRPFSEDQFTARDLTARQFAELYRNNPEDFPAECRERSYEIRLREAYPIHPEVFDRLYNDWSTIARFQRTRGVLRLMAAVIHHLWENGDQSPLILPASLAIDDRQVSSELTRYLPDNWTPTIAKDIDGPNSLPLAIDNKIANLGKYSACRRVARTIYLGSAPTARTKRQGIEAPRIRLGCVLPDEPQAVYGDALRRLASLATYLFQDGSRYWYDVRPTVAKLARDLAEQFKRDAELVDQELISHLKHSLRNQGGFSRIHAAPKSGHDVPDELETRLVVLGSEHVYHKDPKSPAEQKALEILGSRGHAPRQFQNTLVFLAADQSRIHELQDAVRDHMAWSRILDGSDSYDLTKNQLVQARERKDSALVSIEERLLETFQWLLIPSQADPHSPIELTAARLRSRNELAVRASQYLQKEEYMVSIFAGTRLRMELDRVPLWRGDHVEVSELAEYFARYPYLQRFQSPKVLLRAIADGLGLLLWQQESFAFADSWSDENSKYLGLRAGGQIKPAHEYLTGLLVKPSVAVGFLNQPPNGDGDNGPEPNGNGDPPPPPPSPKRFYGSVVIDPVRGISKADQVFKEVVTHLNALPGAEVTIEIEVTANFHGAVPSDTVRTVNENCRALGFKSQGFERA